MRYRLTLSLSFLIVFRCKSLEYSCFNCLFVCVRQSLKQQLNTLQEDLRKREARWTSTHNRLRQQIDTLSAENTTLRDQVRTLEKLRLSTWKNAESDREKERGGSGISSNIRTTKSKVRKENPLSENDLLVNLQQFILRFSIFLESLFQC